MGRGDNRKILCFPSQFQLVPVYSLSDTDTLGRSSFTVSGQACPPDQNNPFSLGINEEDGKAWLSCRQLMQRSWPAEIWEMINGREMDLGKEMADSQKFLIGRCINIPTALSTVGAGKPEACNDSYTVRWAKVQKVIRNEIKVSTRYKTSIQGRSRKIIEMIVRL